MYKVLWDEAALKDLKRIDRATAKSLIKKVSHYLAQDPIALGKPLGKNFKGLYRYRFGNYRVIYDVNNDEVCIVIIKVGHRSTIYL